MKGSDVWEQAITAVLLIGACDIGGNVTYGRTGYKGSKKSKKFHMDGGL